MQVFMTEVFYDAQAKGVYYGDIKGYILAH
jgi:hypothetical protein